MEQINLNYAKADVILKSLSENEINEIAALLNEDDSDLENSKKVANILLNEKLVTISNSKPCLLKLTDKGKNHLNKGGFKFKGHFLPESPKSFKEHLEESTNLLTIFGILNALIIFTNQYKDNNKGWIELISVPMYLLSMLVLWEIIQHKIKEVQRNFKFEAFNFYLVALP